MKKFKSFFMENWLIFTVIFGFIGLIVIVAVIFTINMKNQQKELDKLVKKIDSAYTNFSNDSSVVSEKRTDIYEEVFNNAYYIDFNSKNPNWIKMFDEYYTLIDKLSNDYKDIVNDCNKYNFIYDSTKNKCESILRYYELELNNFVTDYKLYNTNIDNYNIWVDSNTAYTKLEKYSPKSFLEYKDYNNNNEIES